MDKMEAEFEEKLRAKGLEVEKIKSSADDLTRALTAEHKNPKEAVDAIRKAVDSTKDQNGQHEWYGILALFAYVVKQMWWERRDEHKIKKVVAETNGGGSSSA